MADSPSIHENFLLMMQEALGKPQLTLEEAMQTPMAQSLLAVLEQNSAPAVAASPRMEAPGPLLEFALSPSVIAATLQDTFTLDGEQPRSEEDKALLGAADLVMIGGQRRLRLRDAIRAELIAKMRGSDPYESMLVEAVKHDAREHAAVGADPVRLPTAWLRCFLSGKFTDLESAPPGELKSAFAARERLRLVPDLPPGVPPLADMMRRLGLAELLEPLRVLIGVEGGWDHTPRTDRFVGREREVEKLRAFVDELSSQSLSELVTRASVRISSAVSNRQPPGTLIIEARGGLGKSALVAKFVLDHALGQSRPFPFAYLDFDRATLDPERPNQLLLEIARQVSLQFAKAQPELDRLVEAIRQELGSESASAKSTTEIQDPFARFAEILHRQVTFGQRAFLLILDTVEVVQWNAAAMGRLAELIDEFRRKGLDELRVVACGRADIPELRKARGVRVPSERIELRPLSTEEARAMANVVGRRGLGDSWNPKWAEAIARPPLDAQSTWMGNLWGRTGAPDVRRDPLAVRVAVDLILRAAPAERPELIAMIAQEGTKPNGDFIARLYEKRIVKHVRDKRAQKLAWPGLVMRRLTVEIARDVLAPLCQLDSQEAEAAFLALGQEIWMVTREGEALRHRPDLRARTLPLMRQKNAKEFEKVALAAVDYFERHQKRSREDCAEWLYHRLLLGEEPRTVDRDITPGVFPLLARAENDFPPDSAAASYLASRTSTNRLSPRRIGQLRPIDALHHLSLTSAGTFALDDAAVDPVALELADQLHEFEKQSSPSPWAIALWVKTGTWSRLNPLPRVDHAFTSPLLRAHAFWTARIAPTFPVSEKLKFLAQYESVIREFGDLNSGRLGVRTMVQLMALARLAGSEMFSEYDMVVAESLATMKPSAHPSHQAAMRTAIILGQQSQAPALRLWLDSRRRGDSERVRNPTFSLAEIRKLARFQPQASELISTTGDLDAPGCIAEEGAVSAVLRILDEMTIGGSDWLSPGHRGLASMFASRDEDWIVPFGYAAHRAAKGRFTQDVMRSLKGYRARRVTGSSTVQEEEAPRDMLVAMRMADEAGDLSRFAGIVLAGCDSDASATFELKSLVDYRTAWSSAMARAADSGDGTLFPPPVVRDQDRPPPPPPVLDKEDPQRNRWGRKAQRDGRVVRAVLESVERNTFYFSLVVESTDGTPLVSPIVFHLHHTFARSIVTVRRIIDKRQAILSDWNAYGVFSIGVQVKKADDQWTTLELDLASLPELPPRFRKR